MFFVGLGKFVGLKMQALKGLPSYLMVLICCITINLMSQVTSNSSTMTIFASILCDMAENLNINPMFILIPSTAAVSFAFSLPVSTPPNAVVFEYGNIILKSVNINTIFRICINAGHGQSRSPAVSYRCFLVLCRYSYFWRHAINVWCVQFLPAVFSWRRCIDPVLHWITSIRQYLSKHLAIDTLRELSDETYVLCCILAFISFIIYWIFDKINVSGLSANIYRLFNLKDMVLF